MIKLKGVVVHPDEITEKWKEIILHSDIRLLGIHPVGGQDSHLRIRELIKTGLGTEQQKILEELIQNGIGIEYELHAMSLLLPREEFPRHPEWFRMDEKGNRNADYNGCASDEDALEKVSDSAAELAKQLPSSTHRYNLWLDDVKGMACHCERCRNLSEADQALKLYNAVLRGLKRSDPQAKQSYLAYVGASEVPEKVLPENGIFLEFAPFERDHHRPLTDEQNRQNIVNAKKLLEFFGRGDAKVLEYWLDNSLYSGWKKPPKHFVLDRETAEKDIEIYEALGFECITTFACYLGKDYEDLYPFPELEGYCQFKK